MSIATVTQLAIPAVLEALRGGLKQIEHPAAAGASAAISELQGAIANGAVTPEQMTLANAHVEKMAAIEAEERKNAMTEVNASLRAEVASSDPYVRRMRPTFGYMMAATWGAQMLAVAYVIVSRPDQAGGVLNAMQALSGIWAVALSVMGVYVYQRSAEKKTGAIDVIQAVTQTPDIETKKETPKKRQYND